MSAVKPILRAVKLGTKQIDEVATAAAVSRAPVTRGLAADAAEELRRIEADEAAELGYTQQQMDELDADVMDIANSIPESMVRDQDLSNSALFKQLMQEERTKNRRADMLRTDDDSGFALAQSQNTEEYAERMRKVFWNEDFMRNQGRETELNMPIPKEEVTLSNKLWNLDQSVFRSRVLQGRTKRQAQEWVGDSPYVDPKTGEPMILFHVDTYTDPTRPDDFIQFTKGEEFGVHSGTNRAAEQATIGPKRNQEKLIDIYKKQDEELDELLTDPDDKSIFVEAIEDHIRKTFTGEKSRYSGFNDDEVREIVAAAADKIGADEVRANRLIDIIANRKRPSTTPHLFRGRNGLYLHDTGGFGYQAVQRQLEDIFPEDWGKLQRKLEAVEEAERAKPQLERDFVQARIKTMQDFIEEKGFDHVVYTNSMEDRGSISIINWNPDLYQPIWQIGGRANESSRIEGQVAMVMMSLGLGATSAALRETE